MDYGSCLLNGIEIVRYHIIVSYHVRVKGMSCFVTVNLCVTKYVMTCFTHIHCLPIVWNHPSSSSGTGLLSLNGAKFFKQLLYSHPNFQTHGKQVDICEQVFMCLKFGMTGYCLNKTAPFKYNKTAALLLWWFHTTGEQCSKTCICYDLFGLNTVTRLNFLHDH